MSHAVRICRRVALVVALGVLIGGTPALANQGAYQVRNLVSDVPNAAEHFDSNLVNGWGVAFNPFGFVWVADNGTGVSTLYDGNGNPQSLVVTIPGGKPTGIVYNGSGDFIVTKGGVSGPARFLFATENGTIAAWAPNVDPTHAITVVDHSATGTIYKGLTLGGDGTRLLLYAADFHNNKVDVFDKNFSPVTLAGGFADHSISDKYAPFNVQNLGGSIYVAYAKQDDDKVDEVPGRGNGIVNVFDASGNLIRRVFKGGPLNAPGGWLSRPPILECSAIACWSGTLGTARSMRSTLRAASSWASSPCLTGTRS